MRKLAVFIAALALGGLAAFGAVSTNGVAEAAKPIVTPMDECLCGGYMTLVLASRSYNAQNNLTYCTYNRWVNGDYRGQLINFYNGNVGCP